MGRGRANWIVNLSFGDSRPSNTFGPYSEKEAKKIVTRIEKTISQMNKEDGIEDDFYVYSQPIEKWVYSRAKG